jgi:hypothetical protein
VGGNGLMKLRGRTAEWSQSEAKSINNNRDAKEKTGAKHGSKRYDWTVYLEISPFNVLLKVILLIGWFRGRVWSSMDNAEDDLCRSTAELHHHVCLQDSRNESMNFCIVAVTHSDQASMDL